MISTGHIFGRLTVVQFQERILVNAHRRYLWRCVCVCGKEAIVDADKLKAGKTQSCGCLRSELSAARLRTHELREHPLYGLWAKMHGRCECRSNRKFSSYGGRGVSVCERWESFAVFLSDVGERPSPRHSLGRIDNDGNYEPSNCRWETAKQQANNRRPRRRGIVVVSEETRKKISLKRIAYWQRLRASTVA